MAWIHNVFFQIFYEKTGFWNSDQKFHAEQFSGPCYNLTLTRPIGLPLQAPVAEKIADQRWLIANPAKKIGTFLYKMMWLKDG